MTKIEELKVAITDIAKEVPDIVHSMDEAKEWDSVKEVIQNIKTIAGLVQDLAKIAMSIKDTITDLSDEDIVSAIAELINDAVDLPWIPESMEQKIFEIGVGMVIHLIKEKIIA